MLPSDVLSIPACVCGSKNDERRTGTLSARRLCTVVSYGCLFFCCDDSSMMHEVGNLGTYIIHTCWVCVVVYYSMKQQCAWFCGSTLPLVGLVGRRCRASPKQDFILRGWLMIKNGAQAARAFNNLATRVGLISRIMHGVGFTPQLFFRPRENWPVE